MATKSKTQKKSNQPAFEDGSFFKDVPMIYLDNDGQWQVDSDKD